jgi:predicted TIM-barrel fold metal-dependent hydrolase
MQSSLTASIVILVSLGATAAGQAASEPIIDVHLHAAPALRAPQPMLEAIAPGVTSSDQAVRDSTLAIMQRLNIVRGVVSGAPSRVASWLDAAPERLLGGIVIAPNFTSIDSLRMLHKAGRLGFMGELQPIYIGKSPADSVMEPYFALAEELDIPAGIHMQAGGFATPAMRVAMGNPLLVEDVLVRHPKLRLCLMHGGYPFLAETIAILRTYRNVYVDVALIDWAIPTEEFHEYLHSLVRAGFGERIMFGSDANNRPQAIEVALRNIGSASFLTPKQKRDILYENAVRFLRLAAAR